MSTTINKRWFKNRLAKGELVCRRKFYYTDDYAHDAATNFGKEVDFKPATKDLFSDWYINASHITGDKEGIIEVYFASCELYEVKHIENLKSA